MTTSLAARPLHLETQAVSEELCALLRKVDPSAWRDGLEATASEEAQRITGRLRTLLAAASGEVEKPEPMRERLGGLLEAMERATPVPMPARAPKEAWATFLREVQPAYEALAATLRTMAVPPPTVRPTNYARSLFHVASGVVALSLIRLLPTRGWLMVAAGSLTLMAWTLETLRRQSDEMNDKLMRLFGKVAHPHERYRVNSSTWYLTALFLLASFAPMPAAEVAVMVLGVADPMAALVGRRFGKTKLYQNRSLEGTLTFFVSGSLVAVGTLAVFHSLPLSITIGLSLAAAGAGAIAELFSSRLDDNFTIPTAAAAAASVAGIVASVAL